MCELIEFDFFFFVRFNICKKENLFMVLFRNMYRINGYVEWRLFLFIKY